LAQCAVIVIVSRAFRVDANPIVIASAAKQSSPSWTARKTWIASELTLLAMTERVQR
jgi:hypothetical protein